MTETTAPTITIDGVTSNPASPVSMVALGCGCVAFFPGHGFTVGGGAGCGVCRVVTTLDSALETWVL